MRFGPRPAPVGVVLHTVMHCLHGVGPEACLHLVNRWPIGAWALMGWTVCVNFVQSSERCNLKNDKTDDFIKMINLFSKPDDFINNDKFT